MKNLRSNSVQTGNQVDGVLQDYLDQLLVDATEQHISPSVTTENLNAVETTVDAPPLEQIQEPVTKTVEAEAVQSAPAPSALRQVNWQDSQGIECLIFKVAGLKLAIPLQLLGGVYPVEDKVTPLFGQAKWSLGVWQGDTSKLTIIDTAQLIMPERSISLAETGYSFFIQLDRSPWALACQEICDTMTLVYDSIKWRGDTSKRPWLAGTVIDQMCALVDVSNIMTLLDAKRIAN